MSASAQPLDGVQRPAKRKTPPTEQGSEKPSTPKRQRFRRGTANRVNGTRRVLSWTYLFRWLTRKQVQLLCTCSGILECMAEDDVDFVDSAMAAGLDNPRFHALCPEGVVLTETSVNGLLRWLEDDKGQIAKLSASAINLAGFLDVTHPKTTQSMPKAVWDYLRVHVVSESGARKWAKVTFLAAFLGDKAASEVFAAPAPGDVAQSLHAARRGLFGPLHAHQRIATFPTICCVVAVLVLGDDVSRTHLAKVMSNSDIDPLPESDKTRALGAAAMEALHAMEPEKARRVRKTAIKWLTEEYRTQHPFVGSFAIKGARALGAVLRILEGSELEESFLEDILESEPALFELMGLAALPESAGWPALQYCFATLHLHLLAERGRTSSICSTHTTFEVPADEKLVALYGSAIRRVPRIVLSIPMFRLIRDAFVRSSAGLTFLRSQCVTAARLLLLTAACGEEEVAGHLGASPPSHTEIRDLLHRPVVAGAAVSVIFVIRRALSQKCPDAARIAEETIDWLECLCGTGGPANDRVQGVAASMTKLLRQGGFKLGAKSVITLAWLLWGSTGERYIDVTPLFRTEPRLEFFLHFDHWVPFYRRWLVGGKGGVAHLVRILSDAVKVPAEECPFAISSPATLHRALIIAAGDSHVELRQAMKKLVVHLTGSAEYVWM